ncbi:MAG: hypothetical protein AABX01_02405 [Candidatus Micrarchaeota archaeon]
MVAKALSRRILSFIRNEIRRVGEAAFFERMGRMPIADHRAKLRDSVHRDKNGNTWKAVDRQNIADWGRRVRLYRIPGNLNGGLVVLKKIEGFENSRNQIALLRRRVSRHNKAKGLGYDLLQPRVYPVSPNIVAMAYHPLPSLEEIIEGTTGRGRKLLRHLQAKGFDVGDFGAVSLSLRERAGFQRSNIVFGSVHKGRIRVIPLIDFE